jgi:hypothetical protein
MGRTVLYVLPCDPVIAISIKEKETGGTSITREVTEKCIQNFSEKPQGNIVP